MIHRAMMTTLTKTLITTATIADERPLPPVARTLLAMHRVYIFLFSRLVQSSQLSPCLLHYLISVERGTRACLYRMSHTVSLIISDSSGLLQNCLYAFMTLLGY